MTAIINNIDDVIHNLTPEELWAMSRNATPIQMNWTAEEMETSEKIWAIMDLTDLDYESVEKILFSPKQAVLGDILIYCERLNIIFLEFVEKAAA